MARSAPPCPICQRPQDPGYRPFCSRRCADVDLGRWLHGSYVIATDEAEDDTPPSPAPGPAPDPTLH